MFVASLVGSMAMGPPALPPLPGEREQPDVAAPSKPTTAPDAGPQPVAPAKPPPPKADSAPPPAPDPAPADPPGDAPTWSIPDAVEPPQPKGAPSETEAEAEAPPRTDNREPLGPAEGRAPRIDDPLGAEAEGVPRWQIPPPREPPFRGTGLYIGAGVTFAIALSEQIVAHIMVKRNCIDPIARGDYDDVDDVGEVVAGCAPGVLPAVALRLHADLALLATIGLAAGGSAVRGTSEAYRDVFGEKAERRFTGLRAAGISLLGVGVVTWFGTGAGGWAWLGRCGSGPCANSARLFSFLTRDISAAMVASGAGMLTFSELYRRRYSTFLRDRALSVGPSVSQNFYGFTLGGRL